jgi:hypothetical protein
MAEYKGIKGFKVQTVSTDPAANAIAGGTWASGGDLNTARQAFNVTNAGTQTASLAAGGYILTPSANSALHEQYDGTSWTEAADLNTARSNGFGAGSQSAAFSGLGMTGTAPVATNSTNTETWNGTSWTEVNEANTARRHGGQFGSTTQGIAASGFVTPGPSSPAVEYWDGTNWTEVAEMNSPRSQSAGLGVSHTAGLIAGGQSSPSPIPGQTAYTESWNGTSWTEIAEINTNRMNLGGTGSQTDGIIFGGDLDPGASATTEYWNGTSWTEINDLSTARVSLGSGGGSSSSGLAFGGNSGLPVNTAATEEFSAPALFTKENLGQVFYNSTSNAFKVTKDNSGIPLGTWASGGSFPTSAVERMGGAGTQTAAVSVAGYNPATPGAFNGVYEYNGTSWSTNPNSYPISVFGLWGSGTQTAGLFVGGSPPLTGATNKFDGTTFTSTGSLNTARYYLASSGTENATIAAGGATPASIANTESFNGSTWTEVNDLSTPHNQFSQTGTATASLAIGNSPASNIVESWNGTSWSSNPTLNTAKQTTSASGTQTYGLVYSGEFTAPLAQTEFWNGTTWTEVADLSTARYGGGSLGVSAPADNTVIWSGNGGSTATEEWNAPAPFASNVTLTAS